MTTQELTKLSLEDLTRDELLRRLPKMDLRGRPRINEGEPISARMGADKVEAYDEFIKRSGAPSLQGQTFTIGFKAWKLIDWLRANRRFMDTVQVYLTLDEDQKLSVLFWPYNDEGLPAAEIDGKGGSMTLRAPYNIGNKT
jgi:hypothetical protein